MTKSHAISEVFVTALRSLSKREKGYILEKLFADKDLREDIVDMVITRQRRKEKSIPYEHVRQELKDAGRL